MVHRLRDEDFPGQQGGGVVGSLRLDRQPAKLDVHAGALVADVARAPRFAGGGHARGVRAHAHHQTLLQAAVLTSTKIRDYKNLIVRPLNSNLKIFLHMKNFTSFYSVSA